MLAFGTFINRLSRTEVEIHFQYWGGSLTLRVTSDAEHVNSRRYTEEEFAAIDFESMNETPCVFGSFIGHSSVFAFDLPSNPEEFAKHQVSHMRISTFTDSGVNTAWVNICKRYDSKLEGRIAAELAKKLNVLHESQDNLQTDFNRFRNFFDSLGIDYEIPKQENGEPCNNLIYLSGFTVNAGQLIVIKFYEDGKFQEFALSTKGGE